jgi:hypothetical protein
LQSEKKIWTNKTICDEKDISAIKQKEKEQTWFQETNANQEWKKSFIPQKGKGKKTIDRFPGYSEEVTDTINTG